MEKLVRPTGTRFIGISNFSPAQLDNLLKIATIKPKTHQIEVHPYLQQTEFLEKHVKQNITVVAYSPLGNTNPVYTTGGYGQTGSLLPKILAHPIISGIATARSCSPAQVVLEWNMQRKVVVIPKAAQIAHQKENIATGDKCKLTAEDVSKIAGLAKEKELRVNALPCRDWAYACFEGLGAPSCQGCS